MSIISCAGAEHAAKEIRDFVRKQIEEYDQKSEAAEALRKVEKLADEIIETAADGWY